MNFYENFADPSINSIPLVEPAESNRARASITPFVLALAAL